MKKNQKKTKQSSTPGSAVTTGAANLKSVAALITSCNGEPWECWQSWFREAPLRWPVVCGCEAPPIPAAFFDGNEFQKTNFTVEFGISQICSLSSCLVTHSPAHMWTSSPLGNTYRSGQLTGSPLSPGQHVGSSGYSKSCSKNWRNITESTTQLWSSEIRITCRTGANEKYIFIGYHRSQVLSGLYNKKVSDYQLQSV